MSRPKEHDMSLHPEPTPDVSDDDVEGHQYIPPDERGGGHPTGSERPREGRLEEPNA
jgi:hypothetical protein